MTIFSKLSVYDRKYTYGEMQVMFVLGHIEGVDSFNYKDLCHIAESVYAHWIDGRDASEDAKYEKYPWLEFETKEEDGDIQTYALRTLPKFIELYKESVNND